MTIYYKTINYKPMNEKEAREIVDLWNKIPPKDSIEREARWVSVNQSIGYLECYEKAKGLEEAVKWGIERHNSDTDAYRIFKEALAKWGKEK